MSLELTRRRFQQLLANVGRAGLNGAFPNDFEYYACALEIRNSANDIEDSFIFPVMPSSISEDETQLSNVQKGIASVNTLINPSFQPFQISISGNFGRRFFVLIQDRATSFAGISLGLKKNSPGKFVAPEFDVSVKNGYACIKILERMYRQSNSLDEFGKPYRAFFYNLALNSNYMVNLDGFRKSQNDRQSNMIWNYQLVMTATAPATAIIPKNKSSLGSILIFDNVNRVSTDFGNDLFDLFQDEVNFELP
jgi:hypothetical protein